MHRTLKAATVKPARANLWKQQGAFDVFLEEFNQERPHEALGQKPPQSYYERSTREYPLRMPEARGYPDGWEKRMVRKMGQMKWKGKDIRISDALRGQQIGLKPIEEAKWLIFRGSGIRGL